MHRNQWGVRVGDSTVRDSVVRSKGDSSGDLIQEWGRLPWKPSSPSRLLSAWKVRLPMPGVCHFVKGWVVYLVVTLRPSPPSASPRGVTTELLAEHFLGARLFSKSSTATSESSQKCLSDR